MRLVWLAGIALLSAPAVGQPLKVVGSSVRFDNAAQVVNFEIEFNHKPDFFTLDAGGRQLDSWQISVDTMPGYNGFGGTSPYPWETIIRGEEIHVEDNIRVRNHILGPSNEPGSGGWGPIAGAVDYTLVDKKQKFSIPYDVLNTQAGTFRFEIDTYMYGEMQPDAVKGSSIPAIPAPAASGILGVGGMVMFRRRR
jgi:hypothetical protein